MARTIEYDTAKVQLSLTELFWEKGFAETSLADIEAATGLNRRQLYNGIGDKHAMFVGALDHFAELAGQQFLAALESEQAGLRDIENLLRLFVRMASVQDPPRGCMVCVASQEEISANPEVACRIDDYFSRIRAAYKNALSRAASKAEVSLNAAQLELRTEALFGTHVALCVLGRAKRPEDQLTRMVDQALADLRV